MMMTQSAGYVEHPPAVTDIFLCAEVVKFVFSLFLHILFIFGKLYLSGIVFSLLYCRSAKVRL